MARALTVPKSEYDVILEMCKAHDLEEAAQMGERSPWDDSAEADEEFVHDRMWAMHGAFEIAKEYFQSRASQQSGGE